ncbi:MAG TPA: hypothetical protein IAC97_06825 [Candidatus Pelethousia gallinarum]|nr:hypothetical protein [Candidatus Pelethousia gallinarum]
MLELLLNYWTMAGVGLSFFGSLLALCLCRKRLSAGAKGLLWVVCAVAALYLLFILWLTLAAGSNPPQEPVPMPAGS